MLVTGAIGDFGTTAAVGHEMKVALQHGSFELNVTQLISEEDRSQPTLDKATCSGMSSITASRPGGVGQGVISGDRRHPEHHPDHSLPAAQLRHPGPFWVRDYAAPLDDYLSITASGQVDFT